MSDDDILKWIGKITVAVLAAYCCFGAIMAAISMVWVIGSTLASPFIWLWGLLR